MAIPWKMRAAAMQRANGHCEGCGSTLDLEVHRIIPQHEGGTYEPGNLRVLCYPCHARAHGSQITRTVRSPRLAVLAEPSSDAVIPVSEVAERLDISSQRVRVLIAEGRLKAEKFGHIWMVKEADLNAISERQIGRPRKEVCPQGHSLDEENTLLYSGGRRECRICMAEKPPAKRGRPKKTSPAQPPRKRGRPRKNPPN